MLRLHKDNDEKSLNEKQFTWIQREQKTTTITTDNRWCMSTQHDGQ